MTRPLLPTLKNESGQEECSLSLSSPSPGARYAKFLMTARGEEEEEGGGSKWQKSMSFVFESLNLSQVRREFFGWIWICTCPATNTDTVLNHWKNYLEIKWYIMQVNLKDKHIIYIN